MLKFVSLQMKFQEFHNRQVNQSMAVNVADRNHDIESLDHFEKQNLIEFLEFLLQNQTVIEIEPEKNYKPSILFEFLIFERQMENLEHRSNCSIELNNE